MDSFSSSCRCGDNAVPVGWVGWLAGVGWLVDVGGVVHACAHVCTPHSVLFSPAQRPARGSWPSATGKVQVAHPIDG